MLNTKNSYVNGAIYFQKSREQFSSILETSGISNVVGECAVSFHYRNVRCKIGYVGNITPEQPYEVEVDGYGIDTSVVSACCEVLVDALEANNIHFEITHFNSEGEEIYTYRHSKAWQFAGSCTDGQRFEIEGINVWKYPWQPLSEVTQVKDPQYGQEFTFTVYQIEQHGNIITFAAGEFSNNVWGFYTNP